ncbi:hypothetical protein SDRG_10028 [Saprolegnia diclina VS20]|uniref:ABC transmembrane type-1 domain-containing protein n=1 Tax=Saprolegnia diclina (strain VS20) TaxID=1156394 RepID=T0QFA9_SAPDV|nr:hypothetical protein SDRG_10028 [Saprolegnia diclina VS20]EQC32280.1 hypothetical protein SDRG_10028 [Saprolegnia diclina VS20]|eukprot:XP_008614221.1 hypothetical protein SDRG_10028 [Saprolegnia diclina VS20]
MNTRDDATFSEVRSPTVAKEAKPTPVQHPLATSSYVSIFLMAWLDGLIRRGAISPLAEADIWPVRDADTAAALNRRFTAAWAAAGDKPEFHKVIWATLRREIYASLFIYNVYAIPMLAQPAVIHSLLQFLAHDPATGPLSTVIGISSGYGLAGLLTGLSFLSVTIIDFGQYVTSMMGASRCHRATSSRPVMS